MRDEIYSFEPFDVTAGARFNYNDFAFNDIGTGLREDGNFSALVASIEVARDLSEGVRASASVAQGFRAPNLSDLARDGSFAGGDELGNPDLDPEKSLTFDIGIEAKKGLWSGTFGVFWTEIDDVIGRTLIADPTPGVPGDETYLRDNQGEVRVVGGEAGARVQFAADSPYFAETGIAYTEGRQFDDEIASLDDVPWRRTPPLHGRIAAGWDPRAVGLSAPDKFDQVTLEMAWADDQKRLHPQDLSDPRIGEPTAGWAVWNLDVGGQIDSEGASRWYAGVHNILDKNYRIHGSGFDAPGRSLILGLRTSF